MSIPGTHGTLNQCHCSVIFISITQRIKNKNKNKEKKKPGKSEQQNWERMNCRGSLTRSNSIRMCMHEVAKDHLPENDDIEWYVF